MTPTKDQAIQMAEDSGLLGCELGEFEDRLHALVQAAYKLGRNDGLDGAVSEQVACDMGRMCLGCKPRRADGGCPDRESSEYMRGFSDGLKEAPEPFIEQPAESAVPSAELVKKWTNLASREISTDSAGSNERRQMMQQKFAALAAAWGAEQERARILAEFDRRGAPCTGFYEPHEPAEIIRSMKDKKP